MKLSHDMSFAELKELLDFEASRINSTDFISADPVQFPRKFEKLQDIEIAALLSATLAWGNRTMICRDCSRMFDLMEWQPHSYVIEQGYEDLPDMNIHRTFFREKSAPLSARTSLYLYPLFVS